MSKDQQNTDAIPFGDEPDASVVPHESGTELVSFNGVNFPIHFTALDPREIQEKIMRQLFNAKSIDDAFDVWEGEDKLVGRTYEIFGVIWGPYEATHADGSVETIPMAEFTAVNISDKTGEKEKHRTTAANLVGFLAWAEVNDAFPFTARVQGDKTRRGFTALRFARP